ncbi:MAG: hypothetical protein GF350_15250, partial [Chitinivibrionales bacterium]|nr:hypothetical protein [Chitinivibrionales bacterium]
MLINAFICITGLINAALCFLLLFKKKKKLSVIPSFALAIIIPQTSFIANKIAGTTAGILESQWTQYYGALSILTTLFLLELVRLLVPLDRHKSGFVWLWRGVGCAAALTCLFTRWTSLTIYNENPSLRLTTTGTAILIVHFILNLLVLYTIETSYRALEDYQRRGIRICFIAVAGIAGFQMIFHTNTLLFNALSTKYMLAGIVVNSLLLPAVFSGIFRHRIAREKVAVSREIIYSSITLFIAGAVLLGLGATAYIIQRFGIVFTQFEIFLGVFSTAFLLVFAVTSPVMRGRIIRFAGRHIYQRKYDYRDQFFRLNQTYMTGKTMEESIMQLIIVLKYGAGFENAYVFLPDPRCGDFYLKSTPVSPVRTTESVIEGSSVLVTSFANDTKPLEFSKSHKER